jgi:hypothetical protein
MQSHEILNVIPTVLQSSSKRTDREKIVLWLESVPFYYTNFKDEIHVELTSDQVIFQFNALGDILEYYTLAKPAKAFPHPQKLPADLGKFYWVTEKSNTKPIDFQTYPSHNYGYPTYQETSRPDSYYRTMIMPADPAYKPTVVHDELDDFRTFQFFDDLKKYFPC